MHITLVIASICTTTYSQLTGHTTIYSIWHWFGSASLFAFASVSLQGPAYADHSINNLVNSRLVETTYIRPDLRMFEIGTMSIPTLLPIPLYLSMIGYYHLVAPYFKNEKQRAYILSTLSSAAMTCISIPFVWAYGRHELGGLYEAAHQGWIQKIGEVGVVFFGVYLFGKSTLRPVDDNRKKLISVADVSLLNKDGGDGCTDLG